MKEVKKERELFLDVDEEQEAHELFLENDCKAVVFDVVAFLFF